MADDRDAVLWLRAESWLSAADLVEATGLPLPVLLELVEMGALCPIDARSGEWFFGADCVMRMRTARRLRDDLELETESLALVLSFLERIEALERELRALRAEIPLGQ